MSRITTSRASFSWARPAMRRACSSDVSRFRLLRWIAASLAAESAAAVEPEPPDLGRDGSRNEAVDRLAAGDAGANPPRGDVERLDLEDFDAIRAFQLPQHLVQTLPRVAGPGRYAELRQLEDR